MKKVVALFLAVLMLCGMLAGCSEQKQTPPETAAEKEPVELVVFAAASMTETLTEIADLYKSVAPDVTLTFNFDSSGTLKTQIEEGAVCDLFISAAQKQMDQIDRSADTEKNPDGLDFVASDTRVNLLENKVALCVPDGNPKDIKSYANLAAALQDQDILMAMGNEDVPVGQYTQKILAYFNLDEAALAQAGKLTYGSNVKEVASQVSEGAVDCGVIYSTDAFSANLTVIDTATEEMCGQVIYPAAVLKASAHRDEAKAFLDYLKGAKASEIFTKVGFTPLS